MTQIKPPLGPSLGSAAPANAGDARDFSALAAEVSRGQKQAVASGKQLGHSDPKAGRPDNGRADPGATRPNSPSFGLGQPSQQPRSSTHAQTQQAVVDREASEDTRGGASDHASTTGNQAGVSGRKGRGKVRSGRGSNGLEAIGDFQRERRRDPKPHKPIKRDGTVKKPAKLASKPVKLAAYEKMLAKIIKRDFTQLLAAAPSSGLFSAGARPFTTDANRADPLDAMPPSVKNNLWGSQ